MIKIINSKNSVYLISFLFLSKFIFGIYLANVNPDFFYTPDTGTYVIVAKQLCEVGKFLNVINLPEIYRTPGFPIILMPAICYDINLNYYIVFLNSLSLLLSAYLVSEIIKIMKIDINNVFIFFIFLLDPTLSRYQYSILNEIVVLFFICLILYLFIFGLIKKNPYYFIIGFFALTISTFIRPITLYLPYVLFIVLCLIFIFSRFFQTKFKYSFIIASLVGLLLHHSLIQFWSNRNYEETGVKTFTTQSSVVLYMYITSGIIAEAEKKKWIKNDLDKLGVATIDEINNEVNNKAKEEFKKALIKYPIESIQVGLKGALMTFLTPGTGQFPRMFDISKKNYQKSYYIFVAYGMIWILSLWFLTVYGFVKIEKNIPFLFILIFFIFLTLVSSGPHSYSRYRIPFYPVMIIFLSAGIYNLLKVFKKKIS